MRVFSRITRFKISNKCIWKTQFQLKLDDTNTCIRQQMAADKSI